MEEKATNKKPTKKQSPPNKGKPMSEEQKQKLRDAWHRNHPDLIVKPNGDLVAQKPKIAVDKSKTAKEVMLVMHENRLKTLRACLILLLISLGLSAMSLGIFWGIISTHAVFTIIFVIELVILFAAFVYMAWHLSVQIKADQEELKKLESK